MAKPLILITNDDGVTAPGLRALCDALKRVGDTIVVAPDRERSAASHALTLHRPLRIAEREAGWYAVDGTPTDCVHLAVPEFTRDRLPDLVVSGINRGLNVGDDVTYSGTVAGALEGTLLHIPSIAVSAEVPPSGDPHYEDAANYAAHVAAETLAQGLPDGILLNLNWPARKPLGVRKTRQGTRSYRATSIKRTDPAGRPYHWIDTIDMNATGEADGDHRAIDEGYVSVTPLRVNWTDSNQLRELAKWNLEL